MNYSEGEKMSTVFGRQGYRFVEINVIKTIFGAIVLLPFFLMLRFPLEQLITGSGNILLIILLLIFSRLIGSFIIEAVQELILLPILEYRFSSAINEKGYSNREELKNFPPHRMWKDKLFEKTREEIIILFCIFASLIILWTTFNVANFTPLSFETLTFDILSSDEQNNMTTHSSLIEDLRNTGVSVLVNVLFFVFIVFTMYFLYQALFPLYSGKKYSGKKEKRKWNTGTLERIMILGHFLIFPVSFSLLSFIISKCTNLPDSMYFEIIFLSFILIIIIGYFPVLRAIYWHFNSSLSKKKGRDEENRYGENLENDFVSYYALYYALLTFETKNIKLDSQLYLISAIRSFKLLSSLYVYDTQEKAFLEKIKQEVKEELEPKPEEETTNNENRSNNIKFPSYVIATRLSEILTDDVTDGNFDTAIRYFLGQIEEASIDIISKSENLSPIVYLFKESYKWNPEQLLSMINALNERSFKQKEFLGGVRKIIEDEFDRHDTWKKASDFFEEIRAILNSGDDSKKTISNMEGGFLKIVLQVARDKKKCENERVAELTCQAFYTRFVHKSLVETSVGMKDNPTWNEENIR